MEKKYTIENLVEIMARLREPDGCPWDQAQTHESIKKNMIEETYEAIDALDKGNDAMFCNELGDVLLQVVFHAQMAHERGAFDFDDIVNEICTKLIARHTHVFGEDQAASAEESLGVWEKNKKKETDFKTHTEALDDVAHSLPALMRAAKVQKKAAQTGFDWDDAKGALSKVSEEAAEVVDAVKRKSPKEVEEEVGDLLFSVVNVARLLDVEPETALARTIGKFIDRFSKMEQMATQDGKDLTELDLFQMDELWEKAKKK